MPDLELNFKKVVGWEGNRRRKGLNWSSGINNEKQAHTKGDPTVRS